MQDVAAQPGPARRITVRWTGHGWSTVSETRLESMNLPASDALLPGQGRALHGFWFELTDDKDRPIYRQLVEHPLLAREVTGHRLASDREPGVGGGAEFDILVPDAPSGVQVRFISDERPTPDGRLERLDGAEVVGVVPIERR
jgi:hypothetical protein